MLDAIGFRMARRQPEPGAAIDILYTPVCNRWEGRERLQLEVRDLRESGVKSES
jgi:hypothetical protein